MSGSITDILTTSKNVVTAINNLASTYLSVQGNRIAKNITAATLIQSGAGRVCTVTVIAAGSTDGAVHDAISLAAVSSVNKIWNIYKTATGVASTSMPVVLNMPVKDGLVIVPGTDMVVVVTYS